MNGYGSHTFKLVNTDGNPVYCKFHFKTDQVHVLNTPTIVKINNYNFLFSGTLLINLPVVANNDLFKLKKT